MQPLNSVESPEPEDEPENEPLPSTFDAKSLPGVDVIVVVVGDSAPHPLFSMNVVC